MPRNKKLLFFFTLRRREEDKVLDRVMKSWRE